MGWTACISTTGSRDGLRRGRSMDRGSPEWQSSGELESPRRNHRRSRVRTVAGAGSNHVVLRKAEPAWQRTARRRWTGQPYEGVDGSKDRRRLQGACLRLQNPRCPTSMRIQSSGSQTKSAKIMRVGQLDSRAPPTAGSPASAWILKARCGILESRNMDRQAAQLIGVNTTAPSKHLSDGPAPHRSRPRCERTGSAGIFSNRCCGPEYSCKGRTFPSPGDRRR